MRYFFSWCPPESPQYSIHFFTQFLGSWITAIVYQGMAKATDLIKVARPIQDKALLFQLQVLASILSFK